MTVTPTKAAIENVYTRTLHYFQEISRIPRASGKEQDAAEFLCGFAQEKGLDYQKSTKACDVVIRKPAAKGYEHLEPVVLQAHIDMVCQKESGSTHDFAKDPLELIIRDGSITANGTTLGADNGLGLACILAILESGELAHPPIEALFTSDEEDGLSGAMAVDESFLTGRRLINLDAEKEGVLYNGCAGGIDANFTLPITFEPLPDGFVPLQINLSGLLGGHSGADIHKKHANAHKLMARALRTVSDTFPTRLIRFTGGDKRNVIAREASVLIGVSSRHLEQTAALIADLENIFRHEYEGIEPTLSLIASPATAGADALSQISADKLINTILIMPDGVQAMHGKVDRLVETSCNLGIVRQEQGHIYLCSLIRSFYRTKKLYVLEQMRQLATLSGVAFSASSDYPDWEPNLNSELSARFVRAYQTAFAEKPRVESIHAGLECGYFAEKFPGMDMIACGPTITGAHTTEETLDLPSTKNIVALLLTVLSQMTDKP